MTDWVVQEDWSKVAVGDQVRVVRGDNVLDGEIINCHRFSNAEVHAIALLVSGIPGSLHITNTVWTLFVPAKPAVVIPMEPGWYLAFDKLAESVFPVEVDASGKLLINHAGGNPVKLGDPQRFIPFTPLAPVAVTAKKVLHFFEHDMSDDVFEAARKEFGISSD